MLKLLIAGAWGAAMAFAGAYLNLMLNKAPDPAAAEKEHAPQIEQFKSELTGVPMISDGKVLGYLVFRFDSTVDRAKIGAAGGGHGELDPMPYMLDSAFKACYEFGGKGTIRKIRPADIEALSMDIRKRANERFGAEAVLAVNLEQFNFIRSDEVRGKLMQP